MRIERINKEAGMNKMPFLTEIRAAMINLLINKQIKGKLRGNQKIYSSFVCISKSKKRQMFAGFSFFAGICCFCLSFMNVNKEFLFTDKISNLKVSI